MRRTEFDAEWEALSREELAGMKEWRLQHPRASFREIEATLDRRLDRLRARVLRDTAGASDQADWRDLPPEERPKCPHCEEALISRGSKERRLQTQGGEELVFERSYGTCPRCGTGLFPPRRGIGPGSGKPDADAR